MTRSNSPTDHGPGTRIVGGTTQPDVNRASGWAGSLLHAASTRLDGKRTGFDRSRPDRKARFTPEAFERKLYPSSIVPTAQVDVSTIAMPTSISVSYDDPTNPDVPPWLPDPNYPPDVPPFPPGDVPTN